jgi:hypothetical protein
MDGKADRGFSELPRHLLTGGGQVGIRPGVDVVIGEWLSLVEHLVRDQGVAH